MLDGSEMPRYTDQYVLSERYITHSVHLILSML